MNEEITTSVEETLAKPGLGLQPQAPQTGGTSLGALLPKVDAPEMGVPKRTGLGALLPGGETSIAPIALPKADENGITDTLMQQRDTLLKQAKARLQRYARGVSEAGVPAMDLPPAPKAAPVAPEAPTAPEVSATPPKPAKEKAPVFTVAPSAFGDGDVQGYEYGGVRVELPQGFMDGGEELRGAQMATFNRIIDMMNKAQEV